MDIVICTHKLVDCYVHCGVTMKLYNQLSFICSLQNLQKGYIITKLEVHVEFGDERIKKDG